MSPRGGRAWGSLSRLVGVPDDEPDPPETSTFLRGLTLGALLGAAIAGSAIWSRRSARGTRLAPDDRRSSDRPAGDGAA
jgi:hypothetical protein